MEFNIWSPLAAAADVALRWRISEQMEASFQLHKTNEAVKELGGKMFCLVE